MIAKNVIHNTGRQEERGRGVRERPPYLIDEMHIAISPVLLGQEEALFKGVDLRALGYQCVEFIKSEKATPVVLRRRGQTSS